MKRVITLALIWLMMGYGSLQLSIKESPSKKVNVLEFIVIIVAGPLLSVMVGIVSLTDTCVMNCEGSK